MTNRTETKPTRKVLYVAATAPHLRRFHKPYIDALKKDAEVFLMAKGREDEVDFCIPFQKRMASLANVKNIFKIRKILKKNRFDAVILNTTLAAFLVRAAMIGMRHRPYVCNIVHGFMFEQPFRGKRDRIFHFCERLMKKKTDSMAVMNAHDLGATEQTRFCLGEVKFICGMGVDMPALPPMPDADLRAQYAKEGEFVCTFVGELCAAKGQLFLVRACRRLLDRGIPVKLLLLGEGGGRPELEAEIEALGLAENALLLGNREPVLPYLSITDLYVAASRKEGLPFNILEAMACRLPILATDIKGQSDLLQGTDGALFALDDEDAFCDAVEKIYRTGRYGVGAVEYPILEKYRLEAVFEENLDFMKKGWC